MKTGIFLFPLLLSFLIGIGCQKPIDKKYDVYFFQNSYEKKCSEVSKGGFHLTYKVKLKYPAKDVLGYFDKLMGSKGWVSDYFYGDHQGYWETFNETDEKTKRDYLLFQSLKSWFNESHTLGAVLKLKYQDDSKEKNQSFPTNDIQIVDFKIMPFDKKSVE